MKKSEWSDFTYFTREEFDSPDKVGSGDEMQYSTVKLLDEARSIAGLPFKINSGFRTEGHNKKVGGRPNSSHTKGYAVDISIKTNYERYKILMACVTVGFKRFGIGQNFIHVDNDPLKKPSIWLYQTGIVSILTKPFRSNIEEDL